MVIPHLTTGSLKNDLKNCQKYACIWYIKKENEKKYIFPKTIKVIMNV